MRISCTVVVTASQWSNQKIRFKSNTKKEIQSCGSYYSIYIYNLIVNYAYLPLTCSFWQLLEATSQNAPFDANIPPAKAGTVLVFLIVWVQDWDYLDHWSLVGTPGCAHGNYMYPFILAWVDFYYSCNSPLGWSSGFISQAYNVAYMYFQNLCWILPLGKMIDGCKIYSKNGLLTFGRVANS